MTEPLIAGMPPDTWLTLLLICAIIAAAGAVGLRRLQQRRLDDTEGRFPLCGVTLIAGPLVGLILGGISYAIAPEDWEPIDLREQFANIMMFSIGAGSLVAVVVLLIVDLPKYRRHDTSAEFDTLKTEAEAHD